MGKLPVHLEPPGEIIREELDARGWTQTDLADAMGRPLAAVNEIINGKRRITAKTAAELSTALGIDAQFWLNLESAYQLAQSRPNAASGARARLMEYAPIKEMQRRGWIPSSTDVAALTESVCSFFEIESLSEAPRLQAAFRQSAGDVTTAHVAWCTRAMQKAKAQRVRPFRNSKVDELKSALRSLAAHSEEIRRVPSVLADYGIRFVVVKHLQSTKTDGAALWLDQEQSKHPVIVLSLRYGRIDSFWHNLCHELSHITHRDAFSIDVDLADAKAGEAADEIEERANEEAASMLIPQDELERFILRKRPYFSSKSIIQFANRIKMHPGVIVGQLQYRKAIKYTHSHGMLVQIRENVLETSVSDGWVK